MEYFAHLDDKSIDALKKACGVEVETLNVSENGSYTADKGKAYNKVNVNVESSGGGLETITVHVRAVTLEANTLGYLMRYTGNIIAQAVSLDDFAPVSVWNITDDVLDVELPAVNGKAIVGSNLEGNLQFVPADALSLISDLPNDCVVNGITFIQGAWNHLEITDNANILIAGQASV